MDLFDLPSLVPLDAIRIWKEHGYRQFQDLWTEKEPAHVGLEDATAYYAIPDGSLLSLFAKINDSFTRKEVEEAVRFAFQAAHQTERDTERPSYTQDQAVKAAFEEIEFDRKFLPKKVPNA